MNLKEFMEANEVGEALRIWAYNIKNNPDNKLFEPLQQNNPLILRIQLIRRKQLRITATKTYERELENVLTDMKMLEAENTGLQKDVNEYEKRVKKLTEDLTKQNEQLKLYEVQVKMQQKKQTKPKEEQPLEDTNS